jgi:hypothetical protein
VFNVGDTVCFAFEESDDGPFYLSKEEKLSRNLIE